MANPQTIEELYQQILNRAPDAQGQQYWQQQFGETIDPNEVQMFTAAAQPELMAPGLQTGIATGLAPTTPTAPTTTAAPAAPQYTNVEQLYQGILGRAADQPGMEYWQKQFGETIDPNEIKTFTAAAMPEMSPELYKLYQDVLGRAPDVEGFENWRKQFGETIDEEEAAKFRADAAPELAISQQYKDLYQKVLGREADVEGLGAWMKEFGSEIDPYELNRFKTSAATEIFNKDPSIEGLSTLLKTPDIGYGAVKDAYTTLSGKEDLTDEQKKQLDTIGEKLTNLESTWGKYGVDPLQTETLYQQITGVNKALDNKNWQGSWMSGGDNAAKEAAVRLQKLGVDNLADLKVVLPDVKLSAVELYQGQQVQKDDKGKFIGGGVDEFGRELPKTYLTDKDKTELAFADVDVDYESGATSTSYTSLTEEETKTYDPKTGTYTTKGMPQLIDASSGKVIAGGGMGGSGIGSILNNRQRRIDNFGKEDYNFVLDYYDTGNFFKGKDKTFGIRVTKDGTPVPYITTEKTGLVTTPILPILLSLVGAPYISSLLPGAAVAASGATAAIPATLTNTILTQGIVGGLGAGITGGDVGKGILGGALGAGVTGGLGSLLPTGLDPNIAKAITGTAGNVARTAIMGGDVEDALLGGVLSGVTNYGLSELGSSLDLSPQAVNLASGIIGPTLAGRKINPLTLAMSLARSTPYGSSGATPYSQ